jgi:hypothetical protein
VLILPGLPRLFAFLVLELPVVHDPADRRHRGRRNLDQIEAFLSGKDESLGRRHDAQLLPRVVDYSDFTDSNPLIDAETVITTGRTRSIERDKLPPAKIPRITL